MCKHKIWELPSRRRYACDEYGRFSQVFHNRNVGKHTVCSEYNRDTDASSLHHTCVFYRRILLNLTGKLEYLYTECVHGCAVLALTMALSGLVIYIGVAGVLFLFPFQNLKRERLHYYVCSILLKYDFPAVIENNTATKYCYFKFPDTMLPNASEKKYADRCELNEDFCIKNLGLFIHYWSGMYA